MSAEVYVVVSFSNREQPGLFRLTSAEKVMKIYSSKKYAKNSFNCEQTLGNSKKEENLGIL